MMRYKKKKRSQRAFHHETNEMLSEHSFEHCDFLVLDMSDRAQAEFRNDDYLPLLEGVLREERSRLVPVSYVLMPGETRSKKSVKAYYYTAVQDLSQTFDEEEKAAAAAAAAAAAQHNGKLLDKKVPDETAKKEAASKKASETDDDDDDAKVPTAKQKVRRRVNPAAKTEHRDKRGGEIMHQTNDLPRRVVVIIYPDRPATIYILNEFILAKLMHRIYQRNMMCMTMPPQMDMHVLVNAMHFATGHAKFVERMTRELPGDVVSRLIAYPTMCMIDAFRRSMPTQIQFGDFAPQQQAQRQQPLTAEQLLGPKRNKRGGGGGGSASNTAADASDLLLSEFAVESIDADSSAAATSSTSGIVVGVVGAASSAGTATASADGSEVSRDTGEMQAPLVADERRTVLGAHEFANRLLGQNARLLHRIGCVVSAADKLFQLMAQHTFDENWRLTDLFYLFNAAACYTQHGAFTPHARPRSTVDVDFVPFFADDAATHAAITRMSKMVYLFIVDKERRKMEHNRTLNMLNSAVYFSGAYHQNTRLKLQSCDIGRTLMVTQTRGTVQQRRQNVVPTPVGSTWRGESAHAKFAEFLRTNALVLHEAQLAARPADWPDFDVTVRLQLNDARLADRSQKYWTKMPNEELGFLSAIQGAMRCHRVTPMAVLTSLLNADPSAREARDFMIGFTPLSYITSTDVRYQRAHRARTHLAEHGTLPENIAVGDDSEDVQKPQAELTVDGINPKKRKKAGAAAPPDVDDEAADPHYVPGPAPRRGRPAKPKPAATATAAETAAAGRGKSGAAQEPPKRGRPSKQKPLPEEPLADDAIYVTMTHELWQTLKAANHSSVLLQRAMYAQVMLPARRNYTEPLASPMVAMYLERSENPTVLCHALNALRRLIGMGGTEWLPGTERATLHAQRAGRTVTRFMRFAVGRRALRAVDTALGAIAYRDNIIGIGRVQRGAVAQIGLRSRAGEVKEPRMDFSDIYATLGVLLSGEGPLPVLMGTGQIPLLEEMYRSGKLEKRVARYLRRQYSAVDEQQDAWRVVPDWYKRLMARDHQRAITKEAKARECKRKQDEREEKRARKRGPITHTGDRFLSTSVFAVDDDDGGGGDSSADEEKADDDDDDGVEYDDYDMPDDLRSVDSTTGKFKRPKRPKPAYVGPGAPVDENAIERELRQRAHNLPSVPANGAPCYQTACKCGGAQTEECLTLMRAVLDNAQQPTPVVEPARCCLCSIDTLPSEGKRFRGTEAARFMNGVCAACRQRVPSRATGSEQMASDGFFELYAPGNADGVTLYDIVNELLRYADESDDPNSHNEVRRALATLRFRVRNWVSLAPTPPPLPGTNKQSPLNALKEESGKPLAQRIAELRAQPLDERIGQLGNMWFRAPLRETRAIIAASKPLPGAVVSVPEHWQRIASTAYFFCTLELLALTHRKDVMDIYGVAESDDYARPMPESLPLLGDYFAPFVNAEQVMLYCSHLLSERQCFPLTTSAFGESTAFSGVAMQTIVSCRSMPMQERLQNAMYAGQVPRPFTNMAPLMQELVMMNWTELPALPEQRRGEVRPEADDEDDDDDDDDEADDEKDLRSRAERPCDLSNSTKQRL